MSDSLSSLPTVQPLDFVWLSVARPLLRVPSGTMVVVTTESPPPLELTKWLAFSAAAVAFKADWGTRRGALRHLAIQGDSVHIEVVCAFERLVVFCTVQALAPRELEKLLETGIAFSERYSIEWAAAAYALSALEVE